MTVTLRVVDIPAFQAFLEDLKAIAVDMAAANDPFMDRLVEAVEKVSTHTPMPEPPAS